MQGDAHCLHVGGPVKICIHPKPTRPYPQPVPRFSPPPPPLLSNGRPSPGRAPALPSSPPHLLGSYPPLSPLPSPSLVEGRERRARSGLPVPLPCRPPSSSPPSLGPARRRRAAQVAIDGGELGEVDLAAAAAEEWVGCSLQVIQYIRGWMPNEPRLELKRRLIPECQVAD